MILKRVKDGWEVSHGVNVAQEPTLRKILKKIPWVVLGYRRVPRRSKRDFLAHTVPSTPPINAEYVRQHTHVNEVSWVSELANL